MKKLKFLTNFISDCQPDEGYGLPEEGKHADLSRNI